MLTQLKSWQQYFVKPNLHVEKLEQPCKELKMKLEILQQEFEKKKTQLENRKTVFEKKNLQSNPAGRPLRPRRSSEHVDTR